MYPPPEGDGGISRLLKTIYLHKNTDTAVRNSKRLLKTYGKNLNPEKDNPSTTVHLLVEELNKYL